MNKYLLLAVAGVYLWTSVNYLLDGRKGMFLAFIAYAIANLGFMFDLGE